VTKNNSFHFSFLIQAKTFAVMGNAQGRNEFGWHTTAEQAARNVDLHGKNVIVTGANAGIYFNTVIKKKRKDAMNVHVKY
jgi:hypothetical protein